MWPSSWVYGLFTLSVVIVLWVISLFLINEIFETGIYSKPFFITYVNTSVFIFYLTPVAFKVLKLKLRNQPIDIKEIINNDMKEPGRRTSSVVDLERQIETEELISSRSSDYSTIEAVAVSDEQLPLEQTIRLSFQFCMFWYIANLATNASLKYTSVLSQTILSLTSSFFTLFLGYLADIDTVSRLKVASLLLSLVGIIIITKVDAASHPKRKEFQHGVSMLIGNVLALLGACFYGAYTVLLKLKVKNESRLNTKLFFGFVGIFNLILLWPTLILLHYTGIETFELPNSSFVWNVILANCLITFISDYCWARAVLLTSPLTVTVGLSLTIPLALIGDYVYKKVSMNAWYLVGAMIIGASFVLVNREESVVEETQEQET